MTPDAWSALVATWWPVAIAVAIGLVMGLALRGKRGPQGPDPAPQVHLVPAPDGEAATAASGRAAAPSNATPPATQETVLAELLPRAGTPDAAAPERSVSADAAAPFVQFESKLREWQAYASSDSAVRAGDQPSIDDWDDLMDIDGIDLDLARFLYSEGVHTFEQIAGMSQAQLREVLARGGDRHGHVDPAAWPASARRAIDRR